MIYVILHCIAVIIELIFFLRIKKTFGFKINLYNLPIVLMACLLMSAGILFGLKAFLTYLGLGVVICIVTNILANTNEAYLQEKSKLIPRVFSNIIIVYFWPEILILIYVFSKLLKDDSKNIS